jgi:hypothetical protein
VLIHCHNTNVNVRMHVIAMLDADIRNDDMRKTLVDEHVKSFLCWLIMCDERRVFV